MKYHVIVNKACVDEGDNDSSHLFLHVVVGDNEWDVTFDETLVYISSRDLTRKFKFLGNDRAGHELCVWVEGKE